MNRRRCLSSPTVIVALASLGLPRVILHDLGVTDESDALNALLVFGPMVAWVGAAVICRATSPVRALACVGLAYGVLTAAVHQVLWSRAYDGDPPELGDRLRDQFSDTVEGFVVRGFAFASSVVTGVVLGVVCGLIARVLTARMDRSGKRSS